MLEINNTFDLIFLTIIFIPVLLGGSFVFPALYVYLAFKEGIHINKKEVISERVDLSPIQKIITAIVFFILGNAFLFVFGYFYDFIEAVEAYFRN